MPNRQERTACLRRPAQESAQPGCSTEPSSTAEPLDPQKAVQSCQAFYDNCNAAQRADLRNMWAEILDARERQPSGSFLEKQGYQRQLAKRQKEMARVTGNDIEGQLQYAFKKDPELAQNALRVSPSQEDIQAFQSRGAEHMQFMAQFKSSELSTQLTTDLQRAEGIADADADAAAAGAPAETGQDADCKYRFIPYDHFLCCTAHNFLTHYGGCGAFSAAIFEATNKDWKHASQHHVSKGGKGAQQKSRSLLRQQWAQTMPGTDIEEKVKANTRQDQRGATFLQPGSSLPAWPPSH